MLESELVHLGMAPSPSSNPARVPELSSAHHGTAVVPAAAAPRSTASGPPHPAAAPPGASTGGGNAARVTALQAQWESLNAAMKASLAGDDEAAVKTAFDSMKVIKGQIDAMNSGGGVAAPAVTLGAPRAASTAATGTVVSSVAPTGVPARVPAPQPVAAPRLVGAAAAPCGPAGPAPGGGSATRRSVVMPSPSLSLCIVSLFLFSCQCERA